MFTTPVNSVPCYSTVSFLQQKREELVQRPAWNAVLREWREQTWSEILEVLTPAQGYLMFFNNRGLTVSPLVSLSNPIHFFSINSFLLKYPSCPHPTVILRKILDCGHSYLRGYEPCPARGQTGGQFEKATSCVKWISFKKAISNLSGLHYSAFVVQAFALINRAKWTQREL